MTYTNDQKALIMLSTVEWYSARRKRFESVDRPCELYNDYSVADNMIAKMEKEGIKVITIVDEDYPDSLKDIYDPPYTLYYKGDKSLFYSKDLLAVVGARRVSTYGKNVMQNFAPVFVKSGLKIISGLARGVDSIGHRISLENNSPTVAVVANGLDMCYPSENLDMQMQIAKTGLVISEYPMGTKPLQYHFPERNRIISALSQAVFIPEAGDKSGSLITADYAIEQGRELFVVPGNIFSPTSAGCNKKIKELQGVITLSPEDVISALGKTSEKDVQEVVQLDFTAQAIVDLLKDEALHFDEILLKSGLSVGELSSVLSQLEILGIIRKMQGNYFEIIPQL
ncbi:MAG: DNA-processing protein DprA [Clostridia bacterium]|nr:DNA-processing protein DprA [Clostridia bacterium]